MEGKGEVAGSVVEEEDGEGEGEEEERGKGEKHCG